MKIKDSYWSSTLNGAAITDKRFTGLLNAPFVMHGSSYATHSISDSNNNNNLNNNAVLCSDPQKNN
jgi:hypothetical protein